jgi:hypothetical protein
MALDIGLRLRVASAGGNPASISRRLPSKRARGSAVPS